MPRFDETFAAHTLRPGEREALVWHLAMYRARRTVETLLGTYELGKTHPWTDVLRSKE